MVDPTLGGAEAEFPEPVGDLAGCTTPSHGASASEVRDADETDTEHAYSFRTASVLGMRPYDRRMDAASIAHFDTFGYLRLPASLRVSDFFVSRLEELGVFDLNPMTTRTVGLQSVDSHINRPHRPCDPAAGPVHRSEPGAAPSSNVTCGSARRRTQAGLAGGVHDGW